jgi:hypothetical protein
LDLSAVKFLCVARSRASASAVQIIKLLGNDAPRLGALTVNNMPDLEHYGNLVTYMSMKNIVPPSSEQPPAPPQAPKKYAEEVTRV